MYCTQTPQLEYSPHQLPSSPDRKNQPESGLCKNCFKRLDIGPSPRRCSSLDRNFKRRGSYDDVSSLGSVDSCACLKRGNSDSPRSDVAPKQVKKRKTSLERGDTVESNDEMGLSKPAMEDSQSMTLEDKAAPVENSCHQTTQKENSSKNTEPVENSSTLGSSFFSFFRSKKTIANSTVALDKTASQNSEVSTDSNAVTIENGGDQELQEKDAEDTEFEVEEVPRLSLETGQTNKDLDGSSIPNEDLINEEVAEIFKSTEALLNISNNNNRGHKDFVSEEHQMMERPKSSRSLPDSALLQCGSSHFHSGSTHSGSTHSGSTHSSQSTNEMSPRQAVLQSERPNSAYSSYSHEHSNVKHGSLSPGCAYQRSASMTERPTSGPTQVVSVVPVPSPYQYYYQHEQGAVYTTQHVYSSLHTLTPRPESSPGFLAGCPSSPVMRTLNFPPSPRRQTYSTSPRRQNFNHPPSPRRNNYPSSPGAHFPPSLSNHSMPTYPIPRGIAGGFMSHSPYPMMYPLRGYGERMLEFEKYERVLKVRVRMFTFLKFQRLFVSLVQGWLFWLFFRFIHISVH